MKIAGYTRISVDVEKDQDNTSIENQKEIITAFVHQNFPDAQLDFFVDRDRSGYTFEQREAYRQLRPQLLAGEYNILIVKDFSRFSRRNSLGLFELETLRDAHVRIISVGDAIDYPTKDEWMLIQFKFLMNEFPVTDTSRKIKQIIASRQKEGKWVCAVPYGYRITNTKEMTYDIDPPAAEIVREVFRLYNNGWGYKKIANHLTDQGVPTPRANEIAQKEARGQTTKRTARQAWSLATVQGMLSNDFYIGTLRQKKYRRTGINGSDEQVDGQEQLVFENAHTPIIAPSTFAYTQELLRQRSRGHYRGEKKYPTPYSGYLFCGDCGSPLFSRSRPNLPPQYVCGAYLRRGRKACTAHQIRVDQLDRLLKRYIRRVADHAGDMIETLQQAIRQQPQREAEMGQAIDSLQRQREEAQAQLKALLKRKLVDTMGKSPQQAEILEETYREMEEELTTRIAGLDRQIDSSIQLRSGMIQANRKAKTVLDVFSDILNKPALDKRDIGLIVQRITVYEDHLDVALKSDVDALISPQEGSENFSPDSKDISPLTPSVPSHGDKVFPVNVVSSGDPLEIFTNGDGVVFKKYSLMGGLGDFSAQLCESLYKTTGKMVTITDRDVCLSVAGGGRRELTDKSISPALAQIMDGRQLYQHQPGQPPLPVSDYTDRYVLSTAAPILTQGDVLGCVAFLCEKDHLEVAESEHELAQAIAGFLGRHMES